MSTNSPTVWDWVLWAIVELFLAFPFIVAAAVVVCYWRQWCAALCDGAADLWLRFWEFACPHIDRYTGADQYIQDLKAENDELQEKLGRWETAHKRLKASNDLLQRRQDAKFGSLASAAYRAQEHREAMLN